MEKLQGKLRGDLEWTDIEDSTHAQRDLTAIAVRMKGHGFDVRDVDDGIKVYNRLTGDLECEYRIW